MQAFDIYFLGEMLPDADPDAVKRQVAKLFKVSEDAVDRLFSGKPLRVKQNVDADTASRYRAAFRDAGALLEIVPNGAPAPQRATPAPGTADAAVVGADTPTAPTPAAADDMSLAEPGAIIDHAPAAPPAEIDTSALSALPPNSGSLEDCKIDKEPHPIPDISHLQIVDD
jgi:hypothetical protein